MIRIFIHLYIIILRYFIIFIFPAGNFKYFPVKLVDFIFIINMSLTAIQFSESGWSSVRYIIRHSSNNSLQKVIKEFYFQRLKLILPLTFFYSVLFFILENLVFKNFKSISELFRHVSSIILFIKNFDDRDNKVLFI